MKFGMIENIVYLIANLFCIYMISCFFRIFFEKGVSPKQKVLRIFLYFSYYCVNSIVFVYLVVPAIINLLINFIGNISLIATYEGKWKDRICAVIITIAIYIVCKNLAYSILMTSVQRYILIIGTVVSDLLIFMILLLVKKFVDLKPDEDIAFQEWLVVVILSVCSIFESDIVLANCKEEIPVIIGNIYIILMNVITFYLLGRIQNMYRRQVDITLLEQQNHAYKNQILLWKESEEKIQGLRHDMKNHLFALNQLAKSNNCNEIQKYLTGLIATVAIEAEFASTGNYVLDSFLNMKLGEAKQCGAQIQTKIKVSRQVPMNIRDVSILLGNLLDNALQGLKGCSKKILKVTIKEEPGRLFIQIINSYNGELRKNGNTYYTTKIKKIGHGMGLKNVQRIVNLYHGQMEVHNTKDMFSVKLILFFQ